uniref:Olfactory receptor 6N1-like n=1 Tax=Salarias fasciatus TaxID=181472 RepID=A0A672HB25_SALFA
NLGEFKMLIFVILLLGYIVILGGNSMIIFVVLSDPKLSSPMFFFLCNLSLVDMAYTTTTVPNMLSGLVTGVSTISVQGCFLQMFVFIMLSVTGRATLTVMAYDRYVAICSPLHYSSIMTLPVRLLLVVGAWAFGTACTLPAICLGSRRYYCGANVVKHGWCDPASVRRLVCGDTLTDNIVSLTFGVVAMLTTGVLILTSYILIGLSIFRMGVGERLKAFKTCAAHLTVVTISYSAAFTFTYIKGLLSFALSCFDLSVWIVVFQVRIIVSVLYSALTPFLNPLIYSLRNNELRESIGRMLRKLGLTDVSKLPTATFSETCT